MSIRIAIPDMISPSYFPVIAAVELGFFEREGIDAKLDLVFPVIEAFAKLADKEVDFVGASAHAALYAFPEWRGCKLLCAISQNMYWFLVVRNDVAGEVGDLSTLKGLRIGAAPGPADGLRQMVAEAGIDPDRDLQIAPVPAAAGASVSFGISAAKALEDGELDGFWANGMGAEVALRKGVGRLLLDARRPGELKGALDYTFPAFATTDEWISEAPEQVASAARAVVSAQRALRADPKLATKAAATRFPEYERSLIADLIRRDAPFYDPAISEQKVEAMNRFAAAIGILADPHVSYDRVVAIGTRSEWTR